MKTILKEGAKVFFISALLFGISLALFFIQKNWIYLGLSILFIFVFAYTIFFLRLPNRTVNENPDLIYASADGYVLHIEENVKAPSYIEGNCNKVVIFMHVASMHWNLAPIQGEIEYAEYQKGKLLSAFKSESWQENEKQMIGINDSKNNIKVLVGMIAGLIARRIRFYKKEKDQLKQGDTLGLIKYGSANIIYFPADFEVKVEKGQKSRAGRTIIAQRKNK